MENKPLVNLKKYRKNCKLSQAELAKKIGIERYRIADWEQGRSQPSLDNLVALANALSVSIETLLGTEYIKINESSDEKLLSLIKR